MDNFIKGYISRSKYSDNITLSVGSRIPKAEVGTSWFRYFPGGSFTISVRIFKKAFGFSIKPGTYKQINISVSERKNDSSNN